MTNKTGVKILLEYGILSLDWNSFHLFLRKNRILVKPRDKCKTLIYPGFGKHLLKKRM